MALAWAWACHAAWHYPPHPASPWAPSPVIPVRSTSQNKLSSVVQRPHRGNLFFPAYPLSQGEMNLPWLPSWPCLLPVPRAVCFVLALTDESRSTGVFTIPGTVSPFVDGNRVNVSVQLIPLRPAELGSGLASQVGRAGRHGQAKGARCEKD